MAWERTFAMLKPDTVQRGIIGDVLSRLEHKGFRIIALKLIRVTPELAGKHYAAHVGKPFYEGLISYITSSPVVVMVLEAPQAVEQLRSFIGVTRPNEAAAGTIRGDFGVDISNNLIHASDSVSSAAQEIGVYFSQDELLDYERAIDVWLVGR
jgi:nucleoside-diphosphate kinase